MQPMVTLFHRTTPDAAEGILRAGFIETTIEPMRLTACTCATVEATTLGRESRALGRRVARGRGHPGSARPDSVPDLRRLHRPRLGGEHGWQRSHRSVTLRRATVPPLWGSLPASWERRLRQAIRSEVYFDLLAPVA